jgi:hypothetical protein
MASSDYEDVGDFIHHNKAKLSHNILLALYIVEVFYILNKRTAARTRLDKSDEPG